MFNRIVLALVAIVISVAVSNAKEGKKQEECPTLNRSEIENLISQAPSCQRAISLFEICAFGSSADVGLGAAATEKCEADFLSKLSSAQKRTYDRQQKRCARKYRNQSGSMYRAFEALCGAYVARDYSAKFLKKKSLGGRK